MKAKDIIFKGDAYKEFERARILFHKAIAAEVLEALEEVGFVPVELEFPQGASIINRFVRFGKNTYLAEIDPDNGRVFFKQVEAHYNEADKLIYHEFNKESPVVWRGAELEKFIKGNSKFFTKQIPFTKTSAYARLVAYGYGGVKLSKYELTEVTGKGTVLIFSLKENGIDWTELHNGIKVSTEAGEYIITSVELAKTTFGVDDSVGLIVRKI